MNDILKELDCLDDEITELESLLEEKRKRFDLLWKQRQELCQHNWITKTDTYCVKCGLTKNE